VDWYEEKHTISPKSWGLLFATLAVTGWTAEETIREFFKFILNLFQSIFIQYWYGNEEITITVFKDYWKTLINIED